MCPTHTTRGFSSFFVTHTQTVQASTHTQTCSDKLLLLLSSLNDIMEKRKWDVWVILLHPGEHPFHFYPSSLLPSFLHFFLFLQNSLFESVVSSSLTYTLMQSSLYMIYKFMYQHMKSAYVLWVILVLYTSFFQNKTIK